MPDYITRTVKVTTENQVQADVAPVQGFPLRNWSIRVSLVGPSGKEYPAICFDKVTYKLHPTFTNPNRVVKKPPFLIKEKGWGEFDMPIVLTLADKGGEQTITHDLTFHESHYEVLHQIKFPANRPGLVRLLAESGEQEGNTTDVSVKSEDGKRKFGEQQTAATASLAGPDKKKSKQERAAEMEKLAEGLQKLSEDDLLRAVQTIVDNRTNDMYIKNDVDQGEFHVDLYTLPDNVISLLWDIVNK